MKDEVCEKMRLLVQADVDGQLSPAETASVAAHLEQCPECGELQRKLSALSGRLKEQLTYHSLPDASRQAVLERLAAMTPPEAAGTAAVNDNGPSWWRNLSLTRFRMATPFGAGFAVAAGLAFVFLLPQVGNLSNEVVSDHFRALQPGHLMDVASTDQHKVKHGSMAGWISPRPSRTSRRKASRFPVAG